MRTLRWCPAFSFRGMSSHCRRWRTAAGAPNNRTRLLAFPNSPLTLALPSMIFMISYVMHSCLGSCAHRMGPIDQSRVLTRCRNELAKFGSDPIDGVEVVPEVNQNEVLPVKWIVHVKRPSMLTGSPYEGQCYQLSVTFDEGYPFEPPIVRFVADPAAGVSVPVHRHIYTNGLMCMEPLYKPHWTPRSTVHTLVLSTLTMLADTKASDVSRDHSDVWFSKIHGSNSDPRRISWVFHDDFQSRNASAAAAGVGDSNSADGGGGGDSGSGGAGGGSRTDGGKHQAGTASSDQNQPRQRAGPWPWSAISSAASSSASRPTSASSSGALPSTQQQTGQQPQQQPLSSMTMPYWR